MSDALRVFVIAYANADQIQAMAWSFARSLLRSLSVSRRGAKALGLQDDRDSINSLSGITRRESGLFV